MFEISEGPYSGLTGAEVSASQFAHQYPGFVQKFQEPFSTNLGIGMPMGSSITSSTSKPIWTRSHIHMIDLIKENFIMVNL